MRLRFLLIIMCFIISIIPIAVISSLQNFQIASAFLGLILAITFVVGYVIAHFVSLPLVKLTRNIDEISKGNLDVELEKSEIYEINNLTASLDRVMASLKLAIYKVGLKKEEIFQEVVKEKEEAEKRFEVLLKKIDGWIWEIDEKGICRVCSEKVAAVLGYSPQQIIGKKIYEFLPEEAVVILKDTMNHLSFQKSESETKLDFQWLHHGTKQPVWVRSCLLPMTNSSGEFQGLRCFSRDITDTHIAQNQIEALHKKIAELNNRIRQLPQSPGFEVAAKGFCSEVTTAQEFDYMFLCDENANIIDCTKDIEKKLGYNQQEMLMRNIADVAYLESIEEIRATLETVKKQGSMRLKTIHKKKDGASVFVSEHFQYLKDRNLFICIVKEDVL